MATRKLPLTTNLTILILGGAGLATWMVGACESDERDDLRIGALNHAHDPSLEVVARAPDGYVITPGGVLWHKDCVHQIPDGAEMRPDHSVHLNGKKIAQYGACPHKRYRLAPVPGVGTGWIENSMAYASPAQTWTRMISGSWQVPANPTLDQGQTVFLYPSLTQQNGASILQPVLQWGPSAAGGGSFWSWANWWVDGNQLRGVGTLKTANVGDQMTSSLEMTGSTATTQTWSLFFKDNNTGQSSTNVFTVTNTALFNQAEAGVLEAWSLSDCNAFPSGSSGWTYFSAPTLWQGFIYSDRTLVNPSWQWVDPAYHNWTGPNCNFGGTIGTRGETTVNY